MESVALNVKRSQSENLSFQSKIVSPSPIRKSSKISLNVAKELFDLPSSLEEVDSNNMYGNASSLYKAKLFSLRNDTESPNSISFDSRSSSSIQEDCDSPSKPLTRSYLVVDETEEQITEIVPRASNPIVNDVKFMRCDQEPLKLNFASALMVRP